MTGDRSISFRAVGDISFGDHPLCAGFGTHSRLRGRVPGTAFQHVAGILRAADVRFGNLECTLSESGLRRRDYHSIQMRGHPAYLAGLTEAGFDVLNLANNHSMQHGKEPFRETVRMLEAAGIRPCGVGADDFKVCVPAFVERNGLKVAFLGYSLRPRQYFSEAPLYAEGDNEQILADVRKARAASDCVVVSLHWGDEFIDRPSPHEISLARAIIDAGAALIVGHHPHVLRGVERRGNGYIVYSLGNFVCDMLWDEPLRETAILDCRLTPQGVTDLRLIPARINDNYQPVPLQGAAAAGLSARLEKLTDGLQAAAQSGVAAETMEQYLQAADQALRVSRARSHRYFLRKVYRFPPGIVVQQLATFVRNRLAERGIIKPPESTHGC
jgi:poly-gamma-glutamate synthesis protein (capsule biosynthesis protein)